MASRARSRRVPVDFPGWSTSCALVGGVVWLLAPWLVERSFASLEHVFLFMPLVAAPLALALSAALLEERTGPGAGHARAARRLQPAAAALVVGAFMLAPGAAAGTLTLPWLLVALLHAAGGLRRLRPRHEANRSDLSLLVAHVFLPLGAVWLLLFRLGVAPRGLSALGVLLAALHVHYSGFTLQILIAATGRRLPATSPRLGALHRALALGAVVALPLIASGKLLPAAPLKLAGIAAIVASTLALSITSAGVARTVRSPAVRRLLLISSASIAAAMLVALFYAVGELTHRPWLGITRMVEVHGLLNALGFVFCGLCAHLRASSEGRGAPTAPPAWP